MTGGCGEAARPRADLRHAGPVDDGHPEQHPGQHPEQHPERQLDRLLRRAVLDHATTERRVSPPVVLHVGTPGCRVLRFEERSRATADPPPEPLDPWLRTEVVEAMVGEAVRLDPGRDPLVWLTRAVGEEVQDVEHAWLAAVGAASAELGRDLTCVLVDRHGWHDPRRGRRRRWRRIRPRSGPGHHP